MFGCLLHFPAAKGYKFSYKADDEGMRDDMTLDLIHIQIIKTVQVTSSEGEFPDGEIDCQVILHGQFVVERSKRYDARLVPPVKYFVIRLPVMR